MCSVSIDDKRVQFRFQINEIFKSKIGLEQEVNKTKRVKTLQSNIESDMRIDVSVRRTYMPIRDGWPVLTEWMCLFGDNLFHPNECVYLANECVFRRVAPVTTESFLRFLYKEQNTTPKKKPKTTRN